MVNPTQEKNSEPIISKSDVREIIKLLQKMEMWLRELEGLKRFPYDEKGAEALPKGDIHIYRYRNYYDISRIITTATPEDPHDFDSPSYQRERIFIDLQRNAAQLMVTNEGPGTLFVIISHGGEVEFSQETPIFAGDTKIYYNVYELRVRSPTAGLHYRVTEYNINASGAVGFIPVDIANLQNVPLPVANTNWLLSNLTPLTAPTNFRIQVAISIPGNFSAAITNGGNTQIVTFNVVAGPALVAGGVYIFDLLVHSGDTVNFRYNTTGGIIQLLRVQEIDAASA